MADFETISNDDFFTIVVDPNGLNKENVRHEDLFIYVDFRALPKTRSVIETDGSIYNEVFDSKGISFISSATQNGKEYLTTNYTNIGGVDTREEEGFGIEKIDIEFGQDLQPRVNITFVDIRGAGLMNGYEVMDEKGILANNSQFASFFSLPYPIFQLTVKGYYGGTVTYCLTLMGWEMKLDAEKGNFVIEAKFQGHTTAFLSDILPQQVMAITTSDVGQKALKAENVISITELVTRLGQLTRISEEFKKSNKGFEELKFINSLLLERINKISDVLGSPSASDNPSAFGNILPIPQLTNNIDQIFIKDVGIFSSEKTETLNFIVTDLEKYIKDYNDFITKNISSYPYANQYKIDNFNIALSTKSYEINEIIVKAINDELKKSSNNIENGNFTASSLRNRLNLPENSKKVFYIINFTNFRKEVSELKDNLTKKKNLLENEIINTLNENIESQIGFKLNIQSVFNIIMGNVDAYLKVIYDYALAADNKDIQQNRVHAIKGATLDQKSVNYRIYPFPAVFDTDTGNETWLGDIVGEDNPNFPEIMLIKKSINSMISSNGDAAKEKIIDNSKNSLDSPGDSWVPLYVEDIGIQTTVATVTGLPTPYSKINTLTFNGNIVPLELANEIVGRARAAYNFSRYRESTFNYISQIDSTYAFHKTVEPTIRNIINNVDSTVFADSILAIATPTLTSATSVVSIGEETGKFLKQSKKDLAKPVVDLIAGFKSSIEDIFIPTKFKIVHRQLDKANYLIKGDITDLLWNNKVKASIKKFYKSRTSNDLLQDKSVPYIISSIINDLTVFDGQVNPAVDFVTTTDENIKFSNLAGSSIGLGIVNGVDADKSLLEQEYYTIGSPLEKAYLFLLTVPMDSISDFYKILDLAGIYNLTKMQMAWVAAQFWRANYIKLYSEDIFENIINQLTINFSNGTSLMAPNYIAGLISKEKETKQYLPNLNDFSNNFIDIMVKYFENWTTNEYNGPANLILTDFLPEIISIENIVYNYRNLIDSGAKYAPSANHNMFISYYDALLEEIVAPIDFVVNDVNGIKRTVLTSEVLSNDILKQYLVQWITTYKKWVTEANKGSLGGTLNTIYDNSSEKFLIADKEVKIAAYRHFKNLYDKWIGGSIDGKPYNSCTKTAGKKLIERFHFIDKSFNPIGDRAIVDPQTLQMLAKPSGTENLLSFISTLGGNSGFLLYAIPSFIHYKTPQQGIEMWKPQTKIENVNAGSSFVCVYSGGNAKNLDLGKNAYYVNDGFDFRTADMQNIPNGFKKRVPAGIKSIPYEKDKYNLVIFRVGYADQNQGIFKSITVGQENYQNTAEYIKLLAQHTDRGGTKPMYKKANLYNMYAIRSYKCSVTTMGNMMVQTLNYFQLDNIPFFHGAYMIRKVKHSITPNNLETSFEGDRVTTHPYSPITSITSYVSIPLSETLFSDEERKRTVIRPLGGNSYSEAEIGGKEKTGNLEAYNTNFGEVPNFNLPLVTTPAFNGQLILNTEVSILNPNPRNLIQTSNSLDRTGLWASNPYAKLITISDLEVSAIMSKTRSSNLLNIPIANGQTVTSGIFNELDAYLKASNSKAYVVGKGRVARGLGTKVEYDKTYGYIDTNLLPTDERADDKQRAAFAAKYIKAYTLPFTLKWGKNYNTPTNQILLHSLVGNSFIYAMQEVLDFYGISNIEKLGLNLYDGAFVFRRLRSTQYITPSPHAYGIAVDFFSVLNALNSTKKDALFSRAPYTAFIDILEKWGWYSIGRYQDFDWMHFQAAHYGKSKALTY